MNCLSLISYRIITYNFVNSCCVDEKTAHHVPDAEAIIHFGQSCLSPCSNRFNVLYVFTKPVVNLNMVEELFKEAFVQSDAVAIVYDVIYQDVAGKLKYSKIQIS